MRIKDLSLGNKIVVFFNVIIYIVICYFSFILFNYFIYVVLVVNLICNLLCLERY